METTTYYVWATLVIVLGIVVVVLGVWYNVNYGKFKPKFEYKVGQTVTYHDRVYVIEEIKPIDAFDDKYLGQRHGLAAYLKEV